MRSLSVNLPEIRPCLCAAVHPAKPTVKFDAPDHSSWRAAPQDRGLRSPVAASTARARLGDLDLPESRRRRRSNGSGEDPLVCATASSALTKAATMAISLEDSEIDNSNEVSALRVADVASEVDDAIAVGIWQETTADNLSLVAIQ